MRLEDDIKLDYSDVLFRPQRSKLGKQTRLELNELLNYVIVET